MCASFLSATFFFETFLAPINIYRFTLEMRAETRRHLECRQLFLSDFNKNLHIPTYFSKTANTAQYWYGEANQRTSATFRGEIV
jgi:hypothetical protein